MNDTQNSLSVRNIGSVFFAIGSFHFQLLTICQQLTCALIAQAFFKFCPVVTCTALRGLVGQHADNIDNRKKPFFVGFVPLIANTLIFVNLYPLLKSPINEKSHLIIPQIERKYKEEILSPYIIYQSKLSAEARAGNLLLRRRLIVRLKKSRMNMTG